MRTHIKEGEFTGEFDDVIMEWYLGKINTHKLSKITKSVSQFLQVTKRYNLLYISILY